MKQRLCVVTCTTSPARSAGCRASWQATATNPALDTVILVNGSDAEHPYLGTVPAFRKAVDDVLASRPDAEIIACLHDDLEILEAGWDERLLRFFDRHPACGVAGWGGAIGVGDEAIYKVPYNPMQLARKGFRSNLVDAEVHGYRSLLQEPVACLDGFSQIGRRAFWEGDKATGDYVREPPWTLLERLGVVHHAYDGMLGCVAKRYGWEAWYLPLRAKHYGGQTAVGDRGYQAWAEAKVKGGDHALWEQAHKVWYEEFRDVLPVRV